MTAMRCKRTLKHHSMNVRFGSKADIQYPIHNNHNQLPSPIRMVFFFNPKKEECNVQRWLPVR